MNDIFKNTNCIGIMGGTFNPVHIGHLTLIDKTLEQYNDIDKIVVMPNNLPAYKNTHEIVDINHRINMLKLAIEGKDNVVISDLEIVRGGTTYTIDTLKQIKGINPNIKIYFIIGADSLFQFTKWRYYDEILKYCSLLVAKRDSEYDKMSDVANDIIESVGYGEIKFIKTPNVDVASSDIRNEIAHGNIPKDKIPFNVSQYIIDNNLYR